MEANDMLSSLLSDPQKLQSAISMATQLLGGSGDSAPPPSNPPPSSERAEPETPPTMSAAPALFVPPRASGDAAGFDPSAELMSKAMPFISAIARSGKTAVSREKANLLNSVKPFVAGSVGGQIDHAMRLVSMARMARSAMKQFGSAAHSGDDTRE